MKVAKPKKPPALMHHREFAQLLGMPVRTVRDWIERRTLPAPHATIGTLYFYRAEDARYFIAKGRWPAAMSGPKGE